MRIKALLLITAAAALALPASAQSRGYQSCGDQRGNNQIGGAIVGSILGGVLGSNVAAGGHRGDGTAVGAVLGGVIGSGIGGSVGCTRDGRGGYSGNAPPPGSSYYPNPTYGGQYYDGYSGNSPYGYAAPPVNAYPSDPGYYGDGYGYSQSQYGDDDYSDRDHKPRHKHRDGVYADGNRDYKRNDGYTGRDCTNVTQVTRLPDGTEIRKPVDACRDTYYGDWQVRD